ncbi:MAG: hypothetical protein FWE06_04275 [Oscillospiraceae bacterium]|nr:hypothetical protein [Oscillospiraceae bacterium]
MQKIYTITDRLSRVKPWVWLLLALLITLAARLAWILLTANEPVSDFARYHELAAHYANHGTILWGRYTAIFPHTWGYTLVLSWMYSLFGVSYSVAFGFNLALCLAIAALMYDIGAKLFAPWIGGIAALIWAFMPGQVMFVSLICAEMLHLTLMLAAISLYLRIHRAEIWRSRLFFVCACGIVLGFSSIIRPISLVILIALVFHLILSHAFVRVQGYLVVFGKNFLKRGLILCLLLPLFYFGALSLYEHAYLAPTLQRSYDTDLSEFFLDRDVPPIPFSDFPNSRPAMSGGWNLLVGMHAPSNGILNEYLQINYFLPALHDTSRSAIEVQRDFMEQAVYSAHQNLRDGTMLPLLARKTINLWGRDDWVVNWQANNETVNEYGQPVGHISVAAWQRLLSFAANGYYYIVLAAALLSMSLLLFVKKARRRLSPILPLSIAFWGLFFFLLLMETNARYPYPANALLILIGTGLLTLLTRPTRKKILSADGHEVVGIYDEPHTPSLTDTPAKITTQPAESTPAPDQNAASPAQNAGLSQEKATLSDQNAGLPHETATMPPKTIVSPSEATPPPLQNTPKTALSVETDPPSSL